MMSDKKATEREISTAQAIFKDARVECKDLIREFLREEREVMHLKRRGEIHQRLYDHVKRVIK